MITSSVNSKFEIPTVFSPGIDTGMPGSSTSELSYKNGIPQVFKNNLPVKRDDINKIGKTASLSYRDWFVGRIAEWNMGYCNAIKGYPKGATVEKMINGYVRFLMNTIDNNYSEPNNDPFVQNTGWKFIDLPPLNSMNIYRHQQNEFNIGYSVGYSEIGGNINNSQISSKPYYVQHLFMMSNLPKNNPYNGICEINVGVSSFDARSFSQKHDNGDFIEYGLILFRNDQDSLGGTQVSNLDDYENFKLGTIEISDNTKLKLHPVGAHFFLDLSDASPQNIRHIDYYIKFVSSKYSNKDTYDNILDFTLSATINTVSL